MYLQGYKMLKRLLSNKQSTRSVILFFLILTCTNLNILYNILFSEVSNYLVKSSYNFDKTIFEAVRATDGPFRLAATKESSSTNP